MKILTLLLTLFLIGCSSMSVTDYKDREPNLVLEEYFSGKHKAYGVFQDRFGNVRREFTVEIEGNWNEEKQTLTLVEDFVYKDGATEQRIWTIKKTGENTYEGEAPGTVGLAKGKTSGNTFHWTYKFNLPVNGKTWKVSFDDWMWLQDDRILFNKATIKRFGIRLGDVYIFFEKL